MRCWLETGVKPCLQIQQSTDTEKALRSKSTALLHVSGLVTVSVQQGATTSEKPLLVLVTPWAVFLLVALTPKKGIKTRRIHNVLLSLMPMPGHPV